MQGTTVQLQQGDGFIAFSGIELVRVLSSELFGEVAGLTSHRTANEVAAKCHDRWTDLVNACAAMPEQVEFFSLTGSRAHRGWAPGDVDVMYLAVGRGSTVEEAQGASLRARSDLFTIASTCLDYAELILVEDPDLLKQVVSYMAGPHVLEVRRRLEKMRVVEGHVARIAHEPVGFGTKAVRDEPVTGPASHLLHLFPWVPSDDPWRRLLEALVEERALAAVVTHCRGWRRVPPSTQSEAHRRLVAAERLSSQGANDDAVLSREVDVLRNEALFRLAVLQGRALAARVFVTSGAPASAGLVGTVLGSIDDASLPREMVPPDAELSSYLFRSGAVVEEVDPEEMLAPLDAPPLELFFGPREASAILRTPMPSDHEIAGVTINWARTAPMLGRSGEDCPLGFNVHRGDHKSVSMDEAARFRHTYVIGQTGTGKSTLMLNMALHDIRAGRGVAVLDPHGSLMDDILLRFPPERAADLVIVDVTDTDRPVGFNSLIIDEDDPQRYRLVRDLVIDDLMHFLDRTYNMKEVAGPRFETHVRGMFSLMMGISPPSLPMIPNYMVLYALHSNKDLLNALAKRMEGEDPLLDLFIKEALAATHDGSFENMAPYVTSKFNRFIFDWGLRNITCQNELLDIDGLVADGKVLLFHLGKGRFGEQAASLLASQIVSRLRTTVMKRGAGGNHRPFYLYVDEFQMLADERFAEILAEARKFGLALTVAHQFVDQIPDPVLHAVTGNVGTTICLRVGARDGEFLEPLFAPTFRQQDLSSLDNFRAYARCFGKLGHTPFSIQLSPPPADVDPDAAEALRERSRQRYGRDREAVEKEIRETFEAYQSFAGGKGPRDAFF